MEHFIRSIKESIALDILTVLFMSDYEKAMEEYGSCAEGFERIVGMLSEEKEFNTLLSSLERVQKRDDHRSWNLQGEAAHLADRLRLIQKAG